MADISDVTSNLVGVISSVIYPNGTGQPSIAGIPTIVYEGWPQSSQLDIDLSAIKSGSGRIHVTVFPLNAERNTTRYMQEYTITTQLPTTLTLTVSGFTVTVGGTVSVPQNVGLLVGKQFASHVVVANDTPSTIAQALAGQLAGASASGAVITLPSNSGAISGRVGGTGTLSAMSKQQTRNVQITVWADTPANRSLVASAIDSALSVTDFLNFPDGTSGRFIYVSSHIDDMVQKSNLYRRDLVYSVDFTTLRTVSATNVIVGEQITGLDMLDGTTQTISTVYQ